MHSCIILFGYGNTGNSGGADYAEILSLIREEWKEWQAGSGHDNVSDQEMICQMTESHLVSVDIVKYLYDKYLYDKGRIIGFYR